MAKEKTKQPAPKREQKSPAKKPLIVNVPQREVKREKTETDDTGPRKK